jgi:hypothetical protein
MSRYSRNVEPLITPKIASLAAYRPLLLSTQLLVLVDELSVMLDEAKESNEVDKKALESKTKEIRDLAKKIRTDASLDFLDQREHRAILKGVKVDQLGMDAIDQLREMALDLNGQLKTLSRQLDTSTISIEYLKRPSFNSLTKGIEKLSKEIQNSAKRI